jgi:hypothetical protein
VVGAVGQVRHDRQAAVGPQPAAERRAGGGDVGEERVGVESLVPQHEHVRAQQVQQPPGVAGLPLGGRSEHRAQKRPGPGLHQRHQLQPGVPGGGVLTEPGSVAGGVGDLLGGAAVEGHRGLAAEPRPGRARGGQRPGQHLEQPAHRGGPTRRRRSRSAFALGSATASPCRPAVSFAHTRR